MSPDDTSQPGRAAAILKRLRVQAGLSVREMASALGFQTHTTYQYYEQRFKKDHLPPEVYSKVRGVLMGRGVAEPDIRQLLDADLREQIESLDRRLTRIESLLADIAQKASDPEDFHDMPRRKPTWPKPN